MGWTICWKCKERFGLMDDTEALLRRSGQTFHCPWGHSAVFKEGPTEEDKLRRERDRLKQQMARVEQEKSEALRSAERAYERERQTEKRLAAQKGVTKRLKNRVAKGVCPCCNRHFTNLERHMQTKHAGFTVEEVQAEAGQTIQ